MTQATTRLQLSIFRAEFSKSEIILPCLGFEKNEEVRTFVRQLPHSIQVHWEKEPDGERVNLYVLEGEIEGRQEFMPVSLYATSFLPQKLLSLGLQRYFSERGFLVSRSRVGCRVLEPQPTLKRGALVVRRGVRVQAKRPFSDLPNECVIVVSWTTSAEFTASLVDQTLNSMALGQGVLFRPGKEKINSPELSKFRNRYIGTVKEFTSPEEAAVYCSDHSLRLLPKRQLFLEAKPSVLVEYGRRLQPSGKSIWSDILKLNRTLTSNGRRNNAVLKDRLNAIRKFLANGNRRSLTIKATPHDDLVIDIDLKPVIVSIEDNV